MGGWVCVQEFNQVNWFDVNPSHSVSWSVLDMQAYFDEGHRRYLAEFLRLLSESVFFAGS